MSDGKKYPWRVAEFTAGWTHEDVDWELEVRDIPATDTNRLVMAKCLEIAMEAATNTEEFDELFHHYLDTNLSDRIDQLEKPPEEEDTEDGVSP